jgi:acyl-CoA thioester hydrolase
MPYQFINTHQVEFSETDMAGIVHFANFYRMMENTEHAFFRSLGFSIHAKSEALTIGWPRVSAQCEFFRPLRFEDQVEIELLIAEIRTRSIRYVFRFWKSESGERVEVARGSMTTVCAHVENGALQTVAIPDALRSCLQTAPADTLGNAAK